jgi:hypothetical protein
LQGQVSLDLPGDLSRGLGNALGHMAPQGWNRGVLGHGGSVIPGGVEPRLNPSLTPSPPIQVLGGDPGLNPSPGPSPPIQYLGGHKAGDALPADTRQVLNQVLDTAGAQSTSAFIERGGEPARQFLDQVIANASQTADRWGGANLLPAAARQQVVNELTSAIQLDRHFANLEAVASHTVAAARAAALGLLAADAARQLNNSGSRASAAELLRDLRSGAFMPSALFDRPRTLTEAAAVSREMMALLRALEALLAGPTLGLGSTTLAALMKLIANYGMSEQLAGLLLNPGPALPGIAGRFELLRLLALLNGQLLDAKGNPMIKAEGMALKLDEMLWFSLLGGLIHATPDESRFAARLSPLLLYGFDAIFSLVGVDGRALALPRYLAVQVQVNSGKAQSAFGQAPFSEGWIRALIERLKDAALPEHNFLGGQLEEALTDERFFLATLGGRVEAGQAVPGTFALNPVSFGHVPAPVFSTGFAFA